MDPDQSIKLRRHKSREVSSRFLSPISTPPISPKQRSSTPPDNRKHRSHEDSSYGFVKRLWPSSSSSKSNNTETLADVLGNERLKDYIDKKDRHKSKTSVFSLTRQRSFREVEKENTKENHRHILGGSARYTGKLSILPEPALDFSGPILPGRMSFDESALHKSNQRKSNPDFDNLAESESSEAFSSADFSTRSFRRAGVVVSSRYLLDASNRGRKLSSDADIEHAVSMDSSPRMKKFNLKNAIKRTHSLTGQSKATSQWALSPGRSCSPPMSIESKERPMSFSNMKPPTSPSKHRGGVEKLLTLGFDLFKSKKSAPSPLGPGDVDTVHQLKLLHSRVMQWRYANARSVSVNMNICIQVEKNLLYGWNSVTKLQHSVTQKKLQLHKEKLQMKLDFILQSQMRLLESWGQIERQHQFAVSKTKESLHSAVCRVPLIEGAKVNQQSASNAIRHALNFSASIKSMIDSLLPLANDTATLLLKLVKVVAQEKLMIDECFELIKNIAILEIEERSLKCHIIQFEAQQQLQQCREKKSLLTR